MKTNLKSQFGATGVADVGAALRVYEGPVSMRHRVETPIGDPDPAGDEQLR